MSLSSEKPTAIKYTNQPLIEVAFELRFYGEPVVESRRHDFFELIRDDYPLLLVPPLKEGMHPALQHYKFTREDQTAGVNLALNSIGYFQKEYEGAANFIAEAQKIVDVGNELFAVRRFSRIGWRYINSIAFTRENNLIPLARYFKNPPSFFGIESHEYGVINFNATTTFEDEHVSARLLSGENVENGDEQLLFDIDVFKDRLAEIDFKIADVPNELDRLHCIARNFFEQSITDAYRELLKGEIHE